MLAKSQQPIGADRTEEWARIQARMSPEERAFSAQLYEGTSSGDYLRAGSDFVKRGREYMAERLKAREGT